jgi:transposase
MTPETRKRLRWVELFLRLENHSVVCLKCGISRPTLRKWLRRYREKGVAGLSARSRRPKFSPAIKVLDQHRNWIGELRKRNLGSRRIQNELKRGYDFEVSRTTIEKVLRSMAAKPLLRLRRTRKGSTRYTRQIPGERVQMDTCKIAVGVYQYTAIDDCTRIRVLAAYSCRTAANSLLFLEQVMEEMPAVPALSRRSSCVSAALYPPLRLEQSTANSRGLKSETMSVCRTIQRYYL